MFLRSAAPVSSITIRFGVLLACALGAPMVVAQSTVPFSEVHTIAAATTAVPQEFTFSVSTAGNYTVTLTDLGAALTPAAPLASVELAVSTGLTLVGVPLAGAGTLTLNGLAAGTYVLHVVGTPGTAPGSGPFGVEVENAAQAQIAAFQGTLALPSGALPNGLAVLNDSFTVTSGSGGPCAPPQTGQCFTVSLNDLQLPQSLASVTLLLIAQGGATPVAILPNNGVYQASVPLTAGTTYRIFAAGQAGAANAGLYSVVVVPTGGSVPVYGRTVPVGTTMAVGTPTATAGSGVFTLTDLQYPAALTSLAAVVTLTGQVVGQLNASGSMSFTATAGTYDVFAAATPTAAAPAAGSYALELAPTSGAPWLSIGRGVTGAGSALSAYSFDATIPGAGSYTVSLTDFRFPAPLASARMAVVQGGALLGTPLASTGSLSVSAAQGPLSAVIFAQAQPGGSLFGVDAASGTANAVLDATQAVGAIFNAQQLSITAAGSYSVTATDLGFPAVFANYDTIVTRGSSVVGLIYGGGTFNFQATPGTYWISFLAQPAAPANAGTYALSVGTAPAPPIVSLSTDHTQVTSGNTVDIIWSSQNATACSASGGWSGTKAVSGTATSAALTTNTTFTLACTGAGGSSSKSVTVSIAAASSGGGGALSPEWLVALAGLLLLRSRRLGGASARTSLPRQRRL